MINLLMNSPGEDQENEEPTKGAEEIDGEVKGARSSYRVASRGAEPATAGRAKRQSGVRC